MREVRAITSPREANIHRYILLFFMIAAIVVALATVALVAIGALAASLAVLQA